MTLDDRGTLHAKQGERQAALDDYKKALAVAMATAEPLQAALVYSDLMHLEQEDAPPLAIYYGKQAVNLLQQVRGNIHGLDKDLQKTFLASKADYYHDLAELLIAHGRLPEAQQVLDLLEARRILGVCARRSDRCAESAVVVAGRAEGGGGISAVDRADGGNGTALDGVECHDRCAERG